MKPHKDMKLGGNAPMFRGVAVLIAVVMLAGCLGHLPIEGVVVDDVTGAPIGGAVVNLNGLGPMGVFDSSERYPTEETVTDAEGRFHLKGYRPSPAKTYLAIYKQGYACWSNQYIFTGKDVNYRTGRYDYDEWEDNYTYRLVPWQEGWSYLSQSEFLSQALGHARPGPKMVEEIDLLLHNSSLERRRKGGY